MQIDPYTNPGWFIARCPRHFLPWCWTILNNQQVWDEMCEIPDDNWWATFMVTRKTSLLRCDPLSRHGSVQLNLQRQSCCWSRYSLHIRWTVGRKSVCHTNTIKLVKNTRAHRYEMLWAAHVINASNRCLGINDYNSKVAALLSVKANNKLVL